MYTAKSAVIEGDNASQQRIDRVGSVLRGKWTLDRRMGSGRVSTFYAATYRTGQRVALELLEPQWSRDPVLSAGFLRESYVANRVQHPGVVRVLDDGVTEDGALFVVTDLLEGETLDARIVRLGRLPRNDAFDLGDRLLDVVAAGHEAGVVHGDLSTLNVFLTIQGELRVLGYGVARFFAARFPEWSAGVWTAPEMRGFPGGAGSSGTDLDIRSDIWGVGGCLYKTLTGRFEPQPNGQVRSLRELLLDASIETGEVVDRALQRVPHDRWQVARLMQQAWRVAWAESEDAAHTREQTAIDPSPLSESRERRDSNAPSSATAHSMAQQPGIDLGETMTSPDRGPRLPLPTPGLPSFSSGQMIASSGQPLSSLPQGSPSQQNGPSSPHLASPRQAFPSHSELSPQHSSPLVSPRALAHSSPGAPPESAVQPPASSLGGYVPPGVSRVPPRTVLLLAVAAFALLLTGAALAIVAMRIFHYVPGMSP